MFYSPDMLISFTSMVSQVFQVFSMTSPEKDSAKMLQIFLLAPQMFDLHWQNFWVKENGPHSYLFLVKQSSTCTYVFFKKSRLLSLQQPPPGNLHWVWLSCELIPFIHIFASGLSWHSLSERWWSYVVQMLSPLKYKFQENFLFDAESVISSIRSYLMSHLHQRYISSRF